MMLNVFLIYSKDLPDIKVAGQTLERALEIVLMVFLLLVFIHAYSSLHGLGLGLGVDGKSDSCKKSRKNV